MVNGSWECESEIGLSHTQGVRVGMYVISRRLYSHLRFLLDGDFAPSVKRYENFIPCTRF